MKNIYRKLTKKYHPDLAPTELKDEYTKKMQLINKLYSKNDVNNLLNILEGKPIKEETMPQLEFITPQTTEEFRKEWENKTPEEQEQIKATDREIMRKIREFNKRRKEYAKRMGIAEEIIRDEERRTREKIMKKGESAIDELIDNVFKDKSVKVKDWGRCSSLSGITCILKFYKSNESSIKFLLERDRINMESKREFEFIENQYFNEVDKMTGMEFENFLCDFFSKMGYTTEVTKCSGDQGLDLTIDLIIEKYGERTVVHAKRYVNDTRDNAILEVVEAKIKHNCHKSMVITNSYCTKAAMKLAKSYNVELWDREGLEEKLKFINKGI